MQTELVMKLVAMVVVPLLIVASYIYFYVDPSFGLGCEGAARQKFREIALNNSRAFQDDMDKSTGQEGTGRTVLEVSGALNRFAGHFAKRTCRCVEKRTEKSKSTLPEVAFEDCFKAVRADPYDLKDL